jgi:GxxExxY protein
MHENEISKIIFDLGLKIHKNLGPGLLESANEECLFYEISKAGLFVEKQTVSKSETMKGYVHFFVSRH